MSTQPGTLRIATRQSPLAIWQAETVAALLRAENPGLEVELVATSTFGDRRQDLTIPELGGKGVFSKEIQAMVLSGKADIAVHSAKDLQAITPEGLVLAAVPHRGDPRDALVGCRLDSLPFEGTVATGSNRRATLIRTLRPDVNVVGLRGNIATRLTKLEEGGVDAVVMAFAALERLGLDDEGIGHPIEPLDVDRFVPQVGQGALAVEVRAEDRLLELVGRIDHGPSSTTVRVERGFLQQLGGDCNLPAGAHAVALTGADSGLVRIHGMLASEDGERVASDVVIDKPTAEPGRELAQRLRSVIDNT